MYGNIVFGELNSPNISSVTKECRVLVGWVWPVGHLLRTPDVMGVATLVKEFNQVSMDTCVTYDDIP